MSVITGIKAINWYHMRTQLSALGLEVIGLKNRRGSVYAHIKKVYNLKGSKQQVYDQFELLVKEAEPR